MWNNITAQPLIEPISLERYLNGIELVVAGGESDRNARPLITTGYWILILITLWMRKLHWLMGIQAWPQVIQTVFLFIFVLIFPFINIIPRLFDLYKFLRYIVISIWLSSMSFTYNAACSIFIFCFPPLLLIFS